MVMTVLAKWLKPRNANHVTVPRGLIGLNFRRVAPPVVTLSKRVVENVKMAPTVLANHTIPLNAILNHAPRGLIGRRMGCVLSRAARGANQDREIAKMEMTV